MKMVLSVSRSCVFAETQKDIDDHGTQMGCYQFDEIVVVGTLRFFQSSTSHKDKEGSAGMGAGKTSVSLS
jgi:hypothetical protein